MFSMTGDNRRVQRGMGSDRFQEGSLHKREGLARQMISDLVMAKKLEATEDEIHHIMHPHPTFSESIMEAAGQGLGESVNI